MSAIKDLYDLFKDLHNTINDNKILELLIPIEKKLIAADKDLITIQKEQNDTTFQLQSKITELQTENSKLQQRIIELELENTSFKNTQLFQGGIVKELPSR